MQKTLSLKVILVVSIFKNDLIYLISFFGSFYGHIYMFQVDISSNSSRKLRDRSTLIFLRKEEEKVC